MLYLLLAIASSAMISIVMRISTHKVKGSLSMLAVNYMVCLLLAAGYAGFRVITPREPGFYTALTLGGANGVLFLISFILLQSNTRKNGVVLSSIFMRLGLLVPMAVSVFLFRELPTWLQLVGFCIAIGAIVLINLQKGTSTAGSKLGLILLLLSGGTGDAMAKIFERLGTAAMSDQYLFYTFAVAFALCLILVLWKKERPGSRELLFGVLIAIPNFFSAKFLLGALNALPAVIVYPTFSVGTILAVTLAGVLLFRERLGKQQWVALAAILTALVLLNI